MLHITGRIRTASQPLKYNQLITQIRHLTNLPVINLQKSILIIIEDNNYNSSYDNLLLIKYQQSRWYTILFLLFLSFIVIVYVLHHILQRLVDPRTTRFYRRVTKNINVISE